MVIFRFLQNSFLPQLQYLLDWGVLKFKLIHWKLSIKRQSILGIIMRKDHFIFQSFFFLAEFIISEHMLKKGENINELLIDVEWGQILYIYIYTHTHTYSKECSHYAR